MVADLERSPAVDFRPHLPCWICAVPPASAGWPFKRLLVFEPKNAAETAGRDVWVAFQALRLFTGHQDSAQVLFKQLKSQYQSPPPQSIGNPPSHVQASSLQEDPLRWTPTEIGLSR